MAPGIGETLRRIFSPGGPSAGAQPVEEAVAYKGYMVRPAPQREGSQWLVAGVITKTDGDAVKEHKFVRSDIYASRDSAVEFSLYKGQQIIDLEGDRIFE